MTAFKYRPGAYKPADIDALADAAKRAVELCECSGPWDECDICSALYEAIERVEPGYRQALKDQLEQEVEGKSESQKINTCNHQWHNGLNDPNSLYEYCGKCGLYRKRLP